jgi:three-Cys-motif partner protein
LKQWLPTLINKRFKTVLNIFDFFAGTGKDEEENEGSPLLALDIIESFADQIRSNNVKVNLFLNELDEKKCEYLERLAKNRTINIIEFLTVTLTCRDFKGLFDEYLHLMREKSTGNFLFLDQNGISQVTAPVFGEIIKLQSTDFMFFVASETIKRFGGSGRTQKHIDIPREKIWATQHNKIHRTITEYYKSLIPNGQKYYLAPFSIKKPDTGNIYGLVFGTGHLAGLEKFMNVAWNLDSEFGEANYDVDDENIIKRQGFLFSAMKKLTKQELFAEKLRTVFQERSIKTNLELYEFTLTNGFRASHAKEILETLFTDKVLPKQKISFSFKGRWNENESIPIKYD